MRETEEWAMGQAGERAVKEWLKRKGAFVMPAADIENGGAPMFEGAFASMILPDLLASVRGHSWWVEIKTKSRATLYRKTRAFEHGLATRNWTSYLAVEEQSGIPGWLAVLELETGILLLAPLSALEPHARHYRGPAMPDGQPHVFFARELFEWHEGPGSGNSNTAMPKPMEPLAPRTLSQTAAPSHRQLGMAFDVEVEPRARRRAPGD